MILGSLPKKYAHENFLSTIVYHLHEINKTFNYISKLPSSLSSMGFKLLWLLKIWTNEFNNYTRKLVTSSYSPAMFQEGNCV
ncbi:hypothetical protein TNCT_374671 [Trichonephila clavata]|uniref:Uncharacterized protein n=1 Tax=Trichonephila clavata TaxID=2740835 RepID=A0A8X6I463_TRICU|nr:hypothetical protein TNCT_374671 [Trichonephila clavata]